MNEIVEFLALFGLGLLLTLGILFWIILNINFKKERKMKRVPVDLQLLKDILSIFSKKKANKSEAETVVAEQLSNYLEHLEKKNISNLLNAVDEPAQRIVLEFFEIVRDKRVSLKDSGPALRIISDTSLIAKNFDKLQIEINDLDFEEFEIVMLEILKNVKETKEKMQ